MLQGRHALGNILVAFLEHTLYLVYAVLQPVDFTLYPPQRAI
jgi:hypothetical protein